MKSTFGRLLLEPFRAFVLLMAVLILVLQLPTAAKVGKVIAVTIGQAVGVAVSDIGTFAGGITTGQHAGGGTPAPTAPAPPKPGATFKAPPKAKPTAPATKPAALPVASLR